MNSRLAKLLKSKDIRGGRETMYYHKEGVGNIIGGGSSIILATAVIEYEDEIQNVPIPKGSK